MKPIEAWYALLGFLTGTFFELMISMSIGMRNFKMGYREYFVGMDRFALVNQMVIGVVMTGFILYICFFTVFRMSHMHAHFMLHKRTANQELLEALQASFKSN